MRSAAPALLPIFRSDKQAEILSRLFMHPDEEYTLAELAQKLNMAVSTVHKEVGRLATAGIVHSQKRGSTRLLRAETTHPAYRPLTEILELTFGALPVVAEEFAGIKGADEVVIYGSWAARRRGTSGPPPNDVDVLVVGKPERKDVYAAAQRAQSRLALPVNTTVRSRSAWNDAKDPLSAEIRDKPFVIAWTAEPGHQGHGFSGAAKSD